MNERSQPERTQAERTQADDPPHRYSATLAQGIESKWQRHWAEHGTFRQPNPGDPGFDATKPKYYVLDMFPYPSGAGLHVGHPEGYTATDIVSRYRRMKGFNVLHPMGWDAFGLPAEQYAIQTGVHPAVTTKQAIHTFRGQLQRFGFCYDWSRELGTIDEGYYRWTQWIFLQLYRSYYDVDATKARPLADLEAEMAAGKRAIVINPDAAEHDADEKAVVYAAWDALDRTAQRRILDSYRLAYVAEQTVNWCPKLGTALANEEVIDGKSERGGFSVLRKPLRQWLFRITAYAERLIEGLDRVDWPESTRVKQRDWIGRSEGAEVLFPLAAEVGGLSQLRVYTTRPDTLFGATYMVVAPEHPLVDAVLAAPQPETDVGALRDYAAAARNRSDLERQQEKEKTGVFTGLWATNPVNGASIPIWVADYVLMGYGHGAIMAVPAHDDRDWAFAKKFELPIVEVVAPPADQPVEGCFSGEGTNINSSGVEVSIDGLATRDAKNRIIGWLEEGGRGRRKINFKLRDWLFSRQRYWGEPFPIVYDPQGLHHGIDDGALPLTLPALDDYHPEESDEPKPLLAKAEQWVCTTAGAAGVSALPAETIVTRETNTMPGWAGSCWYFLRYCDPKNDTRFVGVEAERYWMGDVGVDLYIGGAEHAVLHLLYARFWHKVLYDLGHVHSDEPFKKLFHQGLITSYAYQRPDRSLVPVDEVDEQDDGQYRERATGAEVNQIVAKMSKSLRNVVNPDDVIAAFGADTFRLYEMYMGPLEASKPWNTKDIHGLFRFLQRAFRLVVDEDTGALKINDAPDAEVEKLLHRAIAKVEFDMERFQFNTAIAAMIGVVNAGTSAGGLSRDQAERFARLLAPFAPHMAEEVWSLLGHAPSIADAAWPTYDEALLRDEEVEVPIHVMGKLRSRMRVAPDASKDALEKAALNDEKIKSWLEGKAVKKIIVVPGRMVNIVTD